MSVGSTSVDAEGSGADTWQPDRAALWVDRILLLAAAAVVLAWAPRSWAYTVDDSFISLRYAHHLAIGHGPVFNIGEPVEGYSCPAWVFAIAFVERLGGAPVATAKGIGVACALALVLLLHAALRRSGVSPPIAGLAALWLAVLPGLNFYASSGMETLPFALAVAAAITSRALVPSPKFRSVFLPLSLFAVATLRPEGLLVLAVLAPLALLHERTRTVRLGVLIVVSVVAALFFARHAYYGEWLPNTYLAKPSPLLHSMRQLTALDALRSLKSSLWSSEALHAPLRHLGGPVLFLGIAIALIRTRTEHVFRPAAAAGIVGLAFLLYAPRDWMPADRFALPFAFPLVLVAALGLNAQLRATSAQVKRVLVAALVVIVLTGSGRQLFETNELLSAMRHGALTAALDSRKFEQIGRWLAANALPDDRVLAYEVGAVGYFSGLRIVDHEGLVSREVARIIHRAGGYLNVRTGRDSAALREVVRDCIQQEPDWFLLRTETRVPLIAGTSVPAGIAREPIQNALLHELHGSLVVAKAFPMNTERNPGHEWYVLLRRSPAAGTE